MADIAQGFAPEFDEVDPHYKEAVAHRVSTDSSFDQLTRDRFGFVRTDYTTEDEYRSALKSAMAPEEEEETPGDVMIGEASALAVQPIQKLLPPAATGQPGIPGIPAGMEPEAPKPGMPILPTAKEALVTAPLHGLREIPVGATKFIDDLSTVITGLSKGGHFGAEGAAVFEAISEDDFDKLPDRALSTLLEEIIPKVEAPKSIVGGLESGIVQMLPSFLPLFGALRASGPLRALAQTGRMGTVVSESIAGTLAGAFSDLAVYDPDGGRLTTLAKPLFDSTFNWARAQGVESPRFEDFVGWLAEPSSPEGNAYEKALERMKGRTKNLAEGALIGTMFDAVNSGVRLWRSTKRANDILSTGRDLLANERGAVGYDPNAPRDPIKFGDRPDDPVMTEIPAESGDIPGLRRFRIDLPGRPEESFDAILTEAGLEPSPKTFQGPVATAREGRGATGREDVPSAEYAASTEAPGGRAGVGAPPEGVRGGGAVSLLDPALETSVPRTARAVLADTLNPQIGGSSYSLHEGNMVAGGNIPKGNIIMSPFPERTRTVSSEAGPLAVEQYIRDNADLLSDPRFFVGSEALPNGMVGLDVSTHLPRRAGISLGKLQDQRAGFDPHSFQTVDIGGTGGPQAKLNEQQAMEIIDRSRPRDTNPVPPAQTVSELEQAFYDLAPDLGPVRIAGPGAEAISYTDPTRLAYRGAAVLASGEREFGEWFRAFTAGLPPDRAAQFADTEIARKMYTQSQDVLRREGNRILRAALQSDLAPEKTFPELERILALQKAGEGNFDWYHGFIEKATRVLGKQDADRFAQLTGALSAQASPSENVDAALDVFLHWKAGKSPNEILELVPFASLHGRRQNTLRALSGEPLSGPKVSRFARALSGDPTAVTPDRWMARVFYPGYKGVPKEEMAQFMESWVRIEAQKLGISPRDMQAQLWEGIKLETGLMKDEVIQPIVKDLEKAIDRMVAEGRMTLPEGLDEAGKISFGTSVVFARTIAGAVAGLYFGDTMEEKIAYGLAGMGLANIAPAAIKAISGAASSAKARQGIKRPQYQELNARASEFQSIAKQWNDLTAEHGRGVIPRAESKKMAEELIARGDISVEKIIEMMPPHRATAEEVDAMVILTVQEADKLKSLAGQVILNPADRGLVDEMIKQLWVLGQLDPRRSGTIKEIGRGLGSLNAPLADMNRFVTDMRRIFTATESGRSPSDVARMIASLPSANQLLSFSNAALKPTFTQIIQEVWINSLLYGAKTQVANFLSNTAFALVSIPERWIAGKISGRGGVVAGEAGALAQGYWGSLSDAWTAAGKAWRDEMPAFGTGKMESHRKAITAENFQLTGPIGDAIDFLGAAVRGSGRLLLAGDEFFKTIAFRGELRAQAYREAYEQIVVSKGLRGQKATEEMRKVMDRILSDPGTEIKEAAERFALYQTFTQDLSGGVGAHVQAAIAHSPMLRYVMPFVRTPFNIAKAAVERTPLGLASKEVRGKLLGRGDTANVALSRARMTFGITTMGMFGFMAANGMISGTGPSDTRIRNQWLEAGWKPMSLKLGGEWVSYARLEPISSVISLAADMSDILSMIDIAHPEQSAAFDELLKDTGRSLSNLFTSKTFLQGLSEFTRVLVEPEKYAGGFAKRFASGFVPFSGALRGIAQANEKELKESQELVNAFKKNIPGLSSSVPPKHDILGDPIPVGSGFNGVFGWIFDVVSPITVSNVKDPETKKIFMEIVRVQEEMGETISTEVPKIVQGVPLTDAQRSALGRMMKDTNLKQDLVEMISAPGWSEVPVGIQHRMLDAQIHAAKEHAKARLLEEDTALKSAVEARYDQKLERITGGEQ